MQVQDEVLLASAAIWDLDCPTAFNRTGIADPHAASVLCMISRPKIRELPRGQMGRCS
ncbi:hypothetical protein FHR70_003455 [Microvirga lupini]|uniref:Uncharacterized protein n=1 Tax=Microvirga lupini TaxID=420324 RepID=A0A7W4YYJ0_9HYPH|nr:hypothetical protein [Microvirga lupini]